MLKIRLKNGEEYEALPGTAIYPSYNSNARNRFEIHMKSDAMDITQFIALFSADNTSEIHIINEVEVDGKTNTVDTAYFDYSVIASIGLQRSMQVDVETGNPTENIELVAVLEQLTFVEKQLKALGINI